MSRKDKLLQRPPLNSNPHVFLIPSTSENTGFFVFAALYIRTHSDPIRWLGVHACSPSYRGLPWTFEKPPP